MNTPHKLPNGDSILLVPIPEDAERFNIYGLDKKLTRVEWFLPTKPMAIHVSADVGKYDVLHNCSVLGKFSAERKTIDFEVKEEWVEKSARATGSNFFRKVLC